MLPARPRNCAAPPTEIASEDGFGPVLMMCVIVPPNLFTPGVYVTISWCTGSTAVFGWPFACDTIVQFGLPKHQVNFEPARPVCVFHALLWKKRNIAVFFPFPIVPIGWFTPGLDAGEPVPRFF